MCWKFKLLSFSWSRQVIWVASYVIKFYIAISSYVPELFENSDFKTTIKFFLSVKTHLVMDELWPFYKVSQAIEGFFMKCGIQVQ